MRLLERCAAWTPNDGSRYPLRLHHVGLHRAAYSLKLTRLLSDFSVNIVQAMDRSLLVDVIPPAQQEQANAWASRMFGFGAVFGYWVGGIDLVYLTRGWLGSEQLKVLTFFTAFFLCACHAVTIVCVKERVLISREEDGIYDEGSSATWRALGEIWVTFRTLPRPIQQVLNVQVRPSQGSSFAVPR